MTDINTAAEARAIVMQAIKNTSLEDVLNEVVRWNNTTENDIDDNGDVWVANPQTGHWLDDDKLTEFAEFLEDC